MIIKGNAQSPWPIKSKSVQVIVTSPPYFSQRVYEPNGNPDPMELGTNESLAEYLMGWAWVCQRALDALRDDGLFFLNIGDTSNGSGGAGGDYNKGGSKEGRPKWRPGKTHLNGAQWLNVPARMAINMQESGEWLLRQEIIWDKGVVRAEDGNHVRRPKPQMEKIYMFSKMVGSVKDYKFHHDRLEEPGNVWHFAPEKSGDKGYAPFPDELARRCILPSSDVGDIVLDPFSGSGTTVKVAKELGRVGIGIELYA